RRVAYVQDNDLYVVGIDDGESQRLTDDGSETVFNGTLDWVYNEELATRAAQPAYAWSPDGNWLIYLRLDESGVARDPVTDFRPVPASVSYTRYPTAGTSNPVATLHALAQGASAPALTVPLPADAEYVLPFFTWTPDANHALFITVNRDHTRLTLNRWTPQSGALEALIVEEDPAWINEERYAAPIFLDDGAHFLWLSERDGFMHLYLYAQDGTLRRQLTAGEWMIDSSAWNLLTPGRPVHVDPAGEWAYFITTRSSPLERQIDRVIIGNGALEQLSQRPGFHLAALSADGRFLVDQFSDAVDTPPVTQVVSIDDRSEVVLSAADAPALDLPDLTREFVTLKAHDGVDLTRSWLSRRTSTRRQRYPVGRALVRRAGLADGLQSLRHDQHLLQHHRARCALHPGGLCGVAAGQSQPGRVTGSRHRSSASWARPALDDQLAGIDYLRTLPYVDATRIGTDGKSFGGYMTYAPACAGHLPLWRGRRRVDGLALLRHDLHRAPCARLR
ncbi:MAG: DPP IV N-terminal domain-containing protein, partial [Caldilineaceae bacterium]